MRFAFRIDLSSIAPCTALCAAAAALIVLPVGVNAQEFTLPQSAAMSETADAGSATLASTTLAAVAARNTAVTGTASATAVDTSVAGTDDSAASHSDLAGNALSIPADAASVSGHRCCRSPSP